MNKNFKIFQIQGLSGLLILTFIFIGLFGGFIVFPVWAIMTGWNILIANTLNVPIINYFQAALLWLALLLLFYLIFRNSFLIKIQKDEIFDNRDIKDIIKEIEERETTKTNEDLDKNEKK
ncbi:MAG: hypothetical protein V2B14_01470 [bacterium]